MFFFVVGLEMISDCDLDKIKKYCRCDVHRSFFSFLHFYSVSYGCLYSAFPSQNIIYETRKYLENIEK